jgi:hypothetical protein
MEEMKRERNKIERKEQNKGGKEEGRKVENKGKEGK